MQLHSNKRSQNSFKGAYTCSDNPLFELIQLNLGKNCLDDKSIVQLIKCQWRELLELNLCHFYEYLAENKITDKGFDILRQGNWPNLKTLFLRSTILSRLQ